MASLKTVKGHVLVQKLKTMGAKEISLCLNYIGR